MILGDALKAKVLRGGAWLGSGSVAEQAARFGRNMILTRLLAPQAFGAMAIVLSATTVLQSFTDIGVSQGLIRNPRGSDDAYVHTAWWMSFGRALMLSAVVFAAAPLVAEFYGNPQLTPLFRFCTLGMLLGGAGSVKATVAAREMKFRKVATIGNVGGICGVAITIVLSFLMRNVWALMIGFCAESAARCVLSYVVCPYLPSLRWNKEAARDLVRFSRGVFGLSFLNLIFARTDIFVLAKLFSPAALGLYTMAIYLVQTPTNFLMNMLGQTLLPAFSAVQTDTGRTNRILSQVNTLLALAGVPALAFMLFSGHSVLRLAYGPRYEAMGASLALASAVSLVNLLNGQITTVFYARGVPQLHRRAVAFMALVMAAVVYPLAKWLGPVGGQVACLIAVVVGFVLQTERLRDVTALKLTGYANALGASVLASLCVVALGLGARPFAALSHPLPNILVGALGCLMAYTLTAVILLRGHRTLLKVGP